MNTLTQDGTWFNNQIVQETLWDATVETLLMVGWSTLATVVIGLPLGILLVATAKGGIRPNKIVNAILSLIVNVGRSIQFIILLILLLPVTDWVMQTNIGWRGMVFPLAIGSIPFFARLVETNLLAVDSGKIEAAQMMGATRTRIMGDVILREALPRNHPVDHRSHHHDYWLLRHGRHGWRRRARSSCLQLRLPEVLPRRPHHHRCCSCCYRSNRPNARRHAQPICRPPLSLCISERTTRDKHLIQIAGSNSFE